MSRLLYFIATLAASALSVFGIRATYEQPAYTIVQTNGARAIENGVQIRRYAPRVAAETDIAGDDAAAFGRLFGYITGANTASRTIPMTVPVEQRAPPAGQPTPQASSSRMIPMTVPVELASSAGARCMRFFLPRSLQASPPSPTDPRVRIVTLPETTMAVIRFTGTASPAARARQTARLRHALEQAGLKPADLTPAGGFSLLSYDPPFAIPFLRRNEIAVALAAP